MSKEESVKTNNEMIGELTRKIDAATQLIKAHNEPIKEEIKSWEKQIARLLNEDGRQQVDTSMFA